MPDDFDELPEDEQQQIVADLEGVIIAVDPESLREEIQRLGKLIEHAKLLEKREVESKLNKLRQVLNEQRIFSDPRMKLLVFTEHKDTLDYLAGDGRDGRPLGKLREWGLSVTQIHGGMPIGDRDTPGIESTPNVNSARIARSSSRPKRPARASTCSSAG